MTKLSTNSSLIFPNLTECIQLRCLLNILSLFFLDSFESSCLNKYLEIITAPKVVDINLLTLERNNFHQKNYFTTPAYTKRIILPYQHIKNVLIKKKHISYNISQSRKISKFQCRLAERNMMLFFLVLGHYD